VSAQRRSCTRLILTKRKTRTWLEIAMCGFCAFIAWLGYLGAVLAPETANIGYILYACPGCNGQKCTSTTSILNPYSYSSIYKYNYS